MFFCGRTCGPQNTTKILLIDARYGLFVLLIYRIMIKQGCQ